MDTYLAHWFESIFQSLGLLIALYFIETTLMELIIVTTILNIRGMMRHDARFIPIVGNHHLLHHKYGNYNFGEYWLDTIFGTKYPNETEYKYGCLYF